MSAYVIASPTPVEPLIVWAATVGAIFAAATVVSLIRSRPRQRVHRRSSHISGPLFTTGEERRRTRSVGDYFEAIRSKPGSALWVLAFVSFTAASWREEGTTIGAIITGLSLITIFPLGYLWWRSWGP